MRKPFSHTDGRRPFESAPQAEVGDELQFHLEQRIRDYVEQGMDPDTARATALERFGNVGEVERECTQLLADDRRAEARRDWIADLGQDLRFGIRSAMHAKLFSLLAIITLAFGIGANAAVFGVIKSVLLDALPYSDSDQLVRILGSFRGSNDLAGLSVGEASDLGARTRSFSSVAAYEGIPSDRVYSTDAGARIIRINWVQPALFKTLGVSPLLGRAFGDEDTRSDTAFSVMLSHSAWQRMFAGDPQIVGKSIRISGVSRTVIGVLPRGFVSPAGETDGYFPLPLPLLLRDPVRARGAHWIVVVARRKPGVSLDAARKEVVTLSNDLAREYPRDDGSIILNTIALHTAMAGDTRTPLLVLMASAGLVLLITCANLAGALLSRTISRRKEFAVRVALGAGRERLMRQLFTESVLLAVGGGIAGFLLAMLGLSALRHVARSALPPYANLSLDTGSLVSTMLFALGTGLAFGIVPALAVGRSNVQSILRDETRGTSESRSSRRLRGALVAGQIALCVSLLAGAGLLARSLWRMTSAPLGFDADGLTTVDVQSPLGKFRTPADWAAFYDQLEDRLRSIPGVVATASVSELPSAQMHNNGLVIEGAPPPANDAQPYVTYASVSDDYFHTLAIPLRSGRTFDAEDRPDAPPSIVISEAMAKRFWPHGNALGARIRLGPDASDPWSVIVGIVGDVRNDPTRPEPDAITYASRRQEPSQLLTFLIRTRGDPASLAKFIQSAANGIDPDLALHNVSTMRTWLSQGLAGRRLPVMLMTSFGALALLLASVGVYAMFAAMAAAREREFGVRVALGSSRQRIAALVLRQGATWMAAGIAGGAIGVILVGSMLRKLLYGVQPFDVMTLAATILMLLTCASIALLGPVRRATRVDPISVMR